jgi:hypothetical protein
MDERQDEEEAGKTGSVCESVKSLARAQQILRWYLKSGQGCFSPRPLRLAIC